MYIVEMCSINVHGMTNGGMNFYNLFLDFTEQKMVLILAAVMILIFA